MFPSPYPGYVPPPATPEQPPALPPDFEDLRKQGLEQERFVRWTALIFAISVLNNLALAGLLLAAQLSGDGGEMAVMRPYEIGWYLLVAGYAAYCALGLFRLKPRTEYPAVVFCALGILRFPVGSLVYGFVLWVLLYRKAINVFKPPYQEALAQTPDTRKLLPPPWQGKCWRALP